MEFFTISDSKYLIHLNKKIPWSYFQKKIKVIPGSYADSFAKTIYSSIFEGSKNLIEEFDKYYKDEYLVIKDFLFWRYGVSEEILSQLSNTRKGYLAIFGFDIRADEEEIVENSLKQLFLAIER